MDQIGTAVSYDTQTELEGSLQHLKLQDCSYFLRTGTCAFGSNCRYNHPTAEKLQVNLSSNNVEDLPERPGQVECQFFMKTGTCKFGPACWYHHPRPKSATNGSGQLQLNFLGLPLRPGEKECAFYLQTGSCKYGSACRFHHPQPTATENVQPSLNSPTHLPNGASGPAPVAYEDQGTTWPVTRAPFAPSTMGMARPSNVMPLATSSPQPIPVTPLQGEKECAFYLQTGSCKYGSACRFYHPQHTAIENAQPSLNSPTQLPNGVSAPTPVAYEDQGTTWPVTRAPFMPSTMGMARPLNVMPSVTSSPQPIPVTRLNPFQQPGLAVQAPSADRGLQLLPGGIDYPYSQGHSATGLSPYSQGHFATGISLGKPTATILHGQTIFPERPGQPDCHHYMKTGDCKFGVNCKYHHPKDRAMSLPSGLNPMGLPLRLGKQACPYYIKHGICKFGPVCKFNHPVNVVPYSPPYSPSLSSLNEIPIVPESSPVSPGSTVSERLKNFSKGDELNVKEPLTQVSGESTSDSTSSI